MTNASVESGVVMPVLEDLTKPIDLSIIIVNWNVANLLRDCLQSISDSLQNDTALHVETIVVDSASTDGSVNMLQQEFPNIRLFSQTENVGFTRGNNIGLGAANGKYLLLLNPDTEIIDDALQHMVQYLNSYPDVGIVGPHTLNSDGSTQSTRRRFPSVALAFFESTWMQRWAPKTLLDRYYVNEIPDDAIADVDWVQGSALMVRRTIYEEIGGLDTGYVMFSEELDWCKRAKDIGWRVVYVGSAQIIHHGGKSTEQVTARKHIHFQESKLRYFSKYHGNIIANLLRMYLLLSYTLQIILETGKSIIGSKPAMRRERIHAYWQVVRSGLKVR